MGYNLPIRGIDWGYNPLSNLLLTSWDIQVGVEVGGEVWRCFFDWRTPTWIPVVELGKKNSKAGKGCWEVFYGILHQKKGKVVEYKGWILQDIEMYKFLGGGFKHFFIFTSTWGNDPIWRIVFRCVEIETTN